jgi:hypothetical protein
MISIQSNLAWTKDVKRETDIKQIKEKIMKAIVFVERLIDSEISNMSTQLSTLSKTLNDLERKKTQLLSRKTTFENRIKLLKSQKENLKTYKNIDKLSKLS